MTLDFLIDGYNLLHHAGLARHTYRPGEFDRARERLLQRVRKGLLPAELQRTTVIFDARDATHVTREERRVFGITVVFSPQGRDADDVIEDFIATHPAPRQLVVVSSDHRLQRAARVRRAIPMDAETFLDELERRPSVLDAEEVPVSTPKVTDSPISEEELEVWLKEFQEIDVQQIQQHVQQELKRPTPAVPVSPANPPPPLPPSKEPSAPEEPRAEIEIDELDFWERRIAELFNDRPE